MIDVSVLLHYIVFGLHHFFHKIQIQHEIVNACFLFLIYWSSLWNTVSLCGKKTKIIIRAAPFCSSATSADRFYRIDKAQVESPLRSSSVQPSGINKYKFWGFHSDSSCFLCAFVWACAFCVFAGAPALCDGDLSGRGVHPGPRGAGEPGPIYRDARPGGGTGIGVSGQRHSSPQLCAQFSAQLVFFIINNLNSSNLMWMWNKY